MQHLVSRPEGRTAFTVRRYHRIKPHVPPLVRAPVNSFEFHRCRRTPQVGRLSLSLGHPTLSGRTASVHRLLRGLPGYLILFDPRAFVPQRQLRLGDLPPRSAFCAISMHFTATPHIPATPNALKPTSSDGSDRVEPGNFTAGLTGRLRTL